MVHLCPWPLPQKLREIWIFVFLSVSSSFKHQYRNVTLKIDQQTTLKFWHGEYKAFYCYDGKLVMEIDFRECEMLLMVTAETVNHYLRWKVTVFCCLQVISGINQSWTQSLHRNLLNGLETYHLLAIVKESWWWWWKLFCSMLTAFILLPACYLLGTVQQLKFVSYTLLSMVIHMLAHFIACYNYTQNTNNLYNNKHLEHYWYWLTSKPWPLFDLTIYFQVIDNLLIWVFFGYNDPCNLVLKQHCD